VSTLTLGQARTVGELRAELRDKLPALAARLDDGRPDDTPVGCVLATRPAAREIVAAHEAPDEIDCSRVEVMSPSFAHELIKAWPQAMFTNANEDVAGSVAVARARA